MDNSAGLDKCSNSKRSSMIKINKDVLFGSMKTGVKEEETMLFGEQ